MLGEELNVSGFERLWHARCVLGQIAAKEGIAPGSLLSTRVIPLGFAQDN